MIYSKKPIEVLWDLVKDLEIQSYKEAMTEDKDSIPDSYLLLRSEVTDTGLIYGDGNAKIRQADCDIILVSKGFATNSTDLHNTNKAVVEAVLKATDIPYSGYNLGYDDILKSTQYTWALEIYYQEN